VLGLVVLAVPAAVWAGAGADQLFGDCDPTGCGDRDRGWFVGVLLTAPLIPLGAGLVAPGVERPNWLARLGRLGCTLVEGVFGLLAFASAAVATGLTESGRDLSAGWLVLAAFCFAIAFFVDRIRRRLPRT
jgi:hypothetical protein